MQELKTEATEKVINQKVSGIPAEDYIAALLEEVENDKMESEKYRDLIAGYKQLNNRHKNIIDAQRVAVKTYEVMSNH